MPVQFVCHHCHKTLKVGRRKIGEEVTCPKCGGQVLVPGQEAAAMAIALAALNKGPAEADIPEFAVFDFDVSAASGIGRRSPAGVAAQPVVSAPAVTSATTVHRRAAAAGAPLGSATTPMLLVSRTTLYAQAVLFLIVALGAFGAGYLIGYGRSPGPATEEAEAQSVVVQGTLYYNDSSGQRLNDAGAVVIALPRDVYPETPWSPKGLRPRDREPAAGDRELLALEEIGASYTRADERGEYLMSVPRPGSYRLLFISNTALRPEGNQMAEADLAELRRYFTPANDLVGRSKYHLATIELAAGEGIVTRSHGFGATGQ